MYWQFFIVHFLQILFSSTQSEDKTVENITHRFHDPTESLCFSLFSFYLGPYY